MQPCRYCGECPPDITGFEPDAAFDTMVEWQQVHLPWFVPAHRKCTDTCECDAVAALAKKYDPVEPEIPF